MKAEGQNGLKFLKPKISSNHNIFTTVLNEVTVTLSKK